MAGSYPVHPIRDAEIDSAYVLARLAAPSLELDAWRQACRAANRAQAEEIAVATGAKGYLHGLARSHVVAEGGETLLIADSVVVSAADETGVRLDLLRYLQRRASELGCAAALVRSPDGAEMRLLLDADLADPGAGQGNGQAGGEADQPEGRPVKT